MQSLTGGEVAASLRELRGWRWGCEWQGGWDCPAAAPDGTGLVPPPARSPRFMLPCAWPPSERTFQGINPSCATVGFKSSMALYCSSDTAHTPSWAQGPQPPFQALALCGLHQLCSQLLCSAPGRPSPTCFLLNSYLGLRSHLLQEVCPDSSLPPGTLLHRAEPLLVPRECCPPLCRRLLLWPRAPRVRIPLGPQPLAHGLTGTS